MYYDHFNVKKYLMNLINGSLQSLVIMIVSFVVAENRILDSEHNYSTFAVTGMLSFAMSVLSSNVKILTFSYTFTIY